MRRFAAAAALAVAPFPAIANAASAPWKTAGGASALSRFDKTRTQMIDIALDDSRTLRGRFVDSTGQPIDGAVVTLRQSERVIARSTTLRDGTFEIERVPAGSYRLLCGSASGQVRCWTSEAAPPNAVVDGVTFQDSVVRGQAVVLAPALLGSSAMTTAAASGMAIGGVATYAAVGDSPNAGFVAPPVAEPTVPPTISIQPGQLVGRDASGNLVRIRGSAPWEQDGSVAPSDAAGVILPPNFAATFDETRLPASP